MWSVRYSGAGLAGAACNPTTKICDSPTSGKSRCSRAPAERQAARINLAGKPSPILGLPDIVTPQRLMVADVKPAVGDHGVGPGLFHCVSLRRLVCGREPAFFMI